ncbi:uncharacterized protein DUF4192 [Kineococcus xinjiangensis]|uniref:Uncharacterized protein DUF4192 n=1 Tax=Kineococcus xinjiangensis TaxID=512762 RepID=A0A2S6IW68_9ACTN|nr:DUF4192 family protein [Kineococcus xinjiangensis]PPK98401.1 uncharacterized protein DUF4192 [Kineococcus xinjiangensis]
MTTTPLLLSSPRDLLASIPYQLGFVPVDSLVVVHLDSAAEPGAPRDGGSEVPGHGPAVPGRLGVTALARVDLPPPGPAGEREVVRALTATAAACAPWAVVAVYDATGVERGGPLPRRSLLGALTRALAVSGAQVLDAWHVGARTYRSYLCDGARGCCPAPGWPVGELTGGTVPAEAVWRGLVAAPSRADVLPDLTLAGEHVREAVRRAGASAAPPSCADGRTAWRAGAWRDWRLVRERYRRGGPGVDVTESARLLAAVRDVSVRDAALVDLAAGAAVLADRVAAGGAPGAVADALSRPPVPGDVAATVRLACDLAARCDGAAGAAALAVAAWASWWGGSCVVAGECAAEALRRDPGHSLAALVARAVTTGLAARAVSGRRPT